MVRMTASKIEWTDRSDWNPVRGCTRVSPGCGGPGKGIAPGGGCYAEAIAARFSAPGQPFHGFAERTSKGPRWTGKVALVEDRLTLPLRWRQPKPNAHGHLANKVFASSTSDIFHESLSDHDIDRIFAVMALAPKWTFQVLTKRSTRMREWFERRMKNPGYETFAHARDFVGDQMFNDHREGHPLIWPLPNVWLGVSVEDQARADERIPDLLATPAAVRFLSCEPLLGPLDLTCVDLAQAEAREAEPSGLETVDALTGIHFDGEGEVPGIYGSPDPKIDWVIAGGESGPKARPMHPDWARSLRDQCAAAGVAFHFKQWGEWIDFQHLDCTFWNSRTDAQRKAIPQQFLNGKAVNKVGKKRAGRVLDGVTHDGLPEPVA